jgi:hypothetical protein
MSARGLHMACICAAPTHARQNLARCGMHDAYTNE